MTNTREKSRALFLAALMVLSVFGGTIAFAGTVASTHTGSSADRDLTSEKLYWQGMTLYIDAGMANASEDWQLREVTSPTTTDFVEEIPLNGTGEAVVSTSGLEGDYVITDDNGTRVDFSGGHVQNAPASIANAQWEVAVQSLTTSFASDSVTQGSNLTLNVNSNRGSYTLTVSASGLSETDLNNIFRHSTTFPLGDTSDGVIGVTAASTITANFTGITTGSYTFNFGTTDTDATGSASVTVNEPGSVTATFANPIVTEERGDIAAFTVNLQNTNQATVFVGSRSIGYLSEVSVTDSNGDGQVTFMLNTHLAGNRSPAGESAAYLLPPGSGDSLGSVELHTQNLTSPLAAGDYELNATVQAGTIETGVGTFVVSDRSTTGAATSIAPRAAQTTTVSEINTAAVDRSTVMRGDKVILKFDVSGIYGYINSIDDLNTTLGQVQGVTVSIVQTNNVGNNPPHQIKTNHSNNRLVLDAANNAFYLVVDSSLATTRQASPEYQATLKLDDDTGNPPSDYVSTEETVSTTFTVQPASITLDGLNADGNLDLTQGEVTVSGTTNAAPGSSLRVRLKSTVTGTPFLEAKPGVQVQSGGVWSTTFDLSSLPVGTTYEVTVSGPTTTTVTGEVLAPPTASVTFNDQASPGGSTVTVASVTMSRGGFVGIHQDSATGPVIGSSKFLTAGTHTNVRVSLDQPITEETTLVAMPHLDTNGNNVYDFPDADGPYVADGAPVIDSASVSVAEPSTRTVTVTKPSPTPVVQTRTVTKTRQVTRTVTITPGGQPGFGVAIALVALLAAALLAIRRRD